jgi:hypothetical protein
MVKFEWLRLYVPGEEPARFDMIIQSSALPISAFLDSPRSAEARRR